MFNNNNNNNKECIAESGRQYEIARKVHAHQQHDGSNKTTVAITEKHFGCTECNEVKDKDRSSDEASSTATLVKPSTIKKIQKISPVTRPSMPLINAPQADSDRTC